MKLFELFGVIEVKNEQANENIKDTTSKSKKLAEGFKKFGSAASKTGKVVAKAGGVMATTLTVLGGGVTLLTNKVIGATDRIDKMSQNINFTTKSFQEWDYILRQTGGDMDAVAGGIAMLTEKAVDASNGNEDLIAKFKMLGFSLKDLQTMSQEEIFEKVITGLQNMENETQKAALASEFLGGAGEEMGALLNGTSDDIARLKNEARDLGLIMSDEVIASGVKLTDTIDKLKGVFESTIAKALAPMLPIFVMIAEQLTTIIPILGDFIGPIAELVIPVLGELIVKILPVLISLINALMPAIYPLIDIFMMLVDDGVLPLVEALIPLIIDIMPSLVKLLGTFTELLIITLPIIIPLLELLAKVLSVALVKAIDNINDMLANFVDGLKNIMTFIEAVFTGDWEQAWKSLGDIVVNIFKGLLFQVKEPINALIWLVNKMIDGVNSLDIKIPDWVPGYGGKELGFNIKHIPLIDLSTESSGSVPSSTGTTSRALNNTGTPYSNAPDYTSAKNHKAPVWDDEESIDTTINGNYKTPSMSSGYRPTSVANATNQTQQGFDLVDLAEALKDNDIQVGDKIVVNINDASFITESSISELTELITNNLRLAGVNP